MWKSARTHKNERSNKQKIYRTWTTSAVLTENAIEYIDYVWYCITTWATITRHLESQLRVHHKWVRARHINNFFLPSIFVVVVAFCLFHLSYFVVLDDCFSIYIKYAIFVIIVALKPNRWNEKVDLVRSELTNKYTCRFLFFCYFLFSLFISGGVRAFGELVAGFGCQSCHTEHYIRWILLLE